MEVRTAVSPGGSGRASTAWFSHVFLDLLRTCIYVITISIKSETQQHKHFRGLDAAGPKDSRGHAAPHTAPQGGNWPGCSKMAVQARTGLGPGSEQNSAPNSNWACTRTQTAFGAELRPGLRPGSENSDPNSDPNSNPNSNRTQTGFGAELRPGPRANSNILVKSEQLVLRGH